MNLCKESWTGAGPRLEPAPLARNQKHQQRGLFSRHKTETTLYAHCRLHRGRPSKSESTRRGGATGWCHTLHSLQRLFKGLVFFETGFVLKQSSCRLEAAAETKPLAAPALLEDEAFEFESSAQRSW